jgi:hypothetical protein
MIIFCVRHEKGDVAWRPYCIDAVMHLTTFGLTLPELQNPPLIFYPVDKGAAQGISLLLGAGSPSPAASIFSSWSVIPSACTDLF